MFCESIRYLLPNEHVLLARSVYDALLDSIPSVKSHIEVEWMNCADLTFIFEQLQNLHAQFLLKLVLQEDCSIYIFSRAYRCCSRTLSIYSRKTSASGLLPAVGGEAAREECQQYAILNITHGDCAQSSRHRELPKQSDGLLRTMLFLVSDLRISLSCSKPILRCTYMSSDILQRRRPVHIPSVRSLFNAY